MFFSFIYGFYIFLLTLLSGALLQKALYKLWAVGNRNKPPHFFRILLLGIVGISSLTALVAFIFKINAVVHFIFVLFVIGGTAIFREEILSWYNYYFKRALEYKVTSIIVFLIYVSSISEASGLVSIGDTGYYHIPLVKWLNEYGLVKGLANLQDSLGFVSGWFYYVSLFDFGLFEDLTYHVLNALAFVWGWVFVALMLIHFREGKYGVKDFLLIPITLLLCSKIQFIASISPQLSLSIMIFWVIYESFSLIEQKNITDAQLGYLILIAAYCVFVKLSAAPVLLFLLVPTIYYIVERWDNRGLSYSEIIKIAIPSIILFSFFIYQNIIVSGYPIYPVPIFDVFNVDWKVPEKQVEFLVEHIRKFGVNPQYQQFDSQYFSNFSWILPWFERNLYSRELVTTVAFVLLPLSVVISLVKLTIHKERPGAVLLGTNYLVLIMAILFWFLSSPDPRFGSVWILTTLFFPLALLLKFNRNTADRWLRVAGCFYLLLLAGWICYFVARTNTYTNTIGDRNYMLVWLRDLNTPEYKRIKIADGTIIHVPEDGFHPRPYNIPLPSTGQELNYRSKIDTAIKRRGHSINKGFKPVAILQSQ